MEEDDKVKKNSIAEDDTGNQNKVNNVGRLDWIYVNKKDNLVKYNKYVIC